MKIKHGSFLGRLIVGSIAVCIAAIAGVALVFLADAIRHFVFWDGYALPSGFNLRLGAALGAVWGFIVGWRS